MTKKTQHTYIQTYIDTSDNTPSCIHITLVKILSKLLDIEMYVMAAHVNETGNNFTVTTSYA